MTEQDSSISETEPQLDRQFVTALARGLDILQCFQPNETDLSNHEFVARTGLPKSTVSRLTHTLTHLGFLQQVADSGRYRMGGAVLRLGYTYLAAQEIRHRARPLMQELATLSGVSVALGTREGDEIVYIECCRGNAPVTLHLGVGSTVDLFTSIIGRAWLAAQLRPNLPALLATAPAETADRVEAARAEIAERGYCTSIGQWLPGVNGVAAPILSADGRMLHAINCGGPDTVLSPDFLRDSIGPRLSAIAAQLSALTPQEIVARAIRADM